MYKVDIFTDKLEYASFAMIDGNQNIELDYLAFDAYTIETRLVECKKGYFVHITEDNEFVCDGIVSDVKPDKATQQISIKPIQTMFDEEVFYTPVNDAITWLAANINNTYLNNADTYQNRPINLTYTTYSESFPLTGFNLHETINILSVMISALKTHGIVVDCSLDLPNKHIIVNIHKSDTNPLRIRADLDNVIDSSVTLGDSYGSKNKAEIQKTKTVDDETTYHGVTNFYLHNDGTIDSTNSNRVWPVFRSIENLQQDDDMTDQDWLDAALARAKEILEPQKYDNEIMLTYSKYDKLIHPNDIPIGREVIIYLKGNTYASVLTGKRIKGNEITLIFGVVRTEFTKKLSIEEREKLTFQNTVSAVIAEADDRYVSSETGTAPNAKRLEYYGEPARPTSADWVSDGKKGGLLTTLSSSSMTTNKPPSEGTIITLPWDWDAWHAQLLVRNNDDGRIPILYHRYKSDTAWQSWKGLPYYRIGDVIITSTNTNPSGSFGGTWILIDKEFAARSGNYTTSTVITSNCTSRYIYASWHGHSIEIDGNFVNKVAITDSELHMFTMTPANFGVSGFAHNRVVPLVSDGGAATIISEFYDDGGVATQDVMQRGSNTASLAAGNTISITLTMNITYNLMLDSFCDKFYWKRTA